VRNRKTEIGPHRNATPQWIWLLGIGAFGVGLRLLYLGQIRSAPFWDLRFGDAASYHQWAQRIAAGDWMGRGAFYQAPLYPYFLALIYRLFDGGVGTVHVIQALMGGLSCALLAKAGAALFGRRGMLAGLLLVVYPAAIFLDALLEKSALATLLLTALLAVIAAAKPEPRTCLAAGAVLGLLALVRENALVLALPLLLWIGFGPHPRWNRMAALAAGCGLALLPVAIRNRVAGGEFLLTTAQFGPNFYIGNHAGADGTYQALVIGHGSATDEREDATRLAEQAAGRRLSAGAVSEYWTGRAFDYIRSQPLAWVGLTARKIALTLNAAETADSESQQVYAEHSWLLRVLEPFDFGVLFGLAGIGAVLTAASWRRLWCLYALAGVYVLSVSAFYVFARYRFPLAPILMLIATGGLLQLGEAWRSNRPRMLAALAAGTATVAFAHLPLDNPRAALATNYHDIAAALAKDPARFADALDYYRRALDVDPGFPAAHFGLATLLTRLDRPVEAIPHYLSAVQAWPDYAEAHYNYGLALSDAGTPDQAEAEFAAASRLRPDDADAHAARGKALLALSRPSEAAECYRKALALSPQNAPALTGMGVALAQLGRNEEAIERYTLALSIDPRNAAAHNSLGTTLAAQGRIADALPHFERALELNPNDVNARRNLEAARQMLPHHRLSQ
jgi:tetratricopeptide (TPR) repeat protein